MKKYTVLKEFGGNKKGDQVEMVETLAKYRVLDGSLVESKSKSEVKQTEVKKDDRDQQDKRKTS